jgi:hypothetical protein
VLDIFLPFQKLSLGIIGHASKLRRALIIAPIIMPSTRRTKLLLINPNITEVITEGFRAPVSNLNLFNV